MLRAVPVWAALLACALSAAGADPAPELNAKTFEKIRARILPTAEEERWRQIGWHASLWQGVVAAHAEKRPIFLWAMNGHPLGCT